MNPTLQAQAAQSARQGQQMLGQDQANANQYKTDYGNYSGQATQANQNLQNYTDYMKGAGSGQNVYNTELGSLENQSGYNPAQMAAANKSLFALNGALNGANNQFNQAGGVGGYGLSAGALGSYESGILNPLQTGVQNANTQVGTLNNQLGTLMTGANQATTSQVQGEQNTVQGLQNVYANANTQAQNALSQMQFYSDLAQKQGGLNAQNQQNFAQAQQAYAAAQQAIAQSGLILSQTTGQNLQNQQTQAAMNANKAQTAQNSLTTPTTVYRNPQGQTVGYENKLQDVQLNRSQPQHNPGPSILSRLNNFMNFGTGQA
jgi:hypothetical protein